MKKSTHLYILLLSILTLLTFGVNSAWGQTYHDGKWYSLYDDENHGDKYSKNKDVTLNTYRNIFIPIAGNVFFDAKLEGDKSSALSKDGQSNESNFSDPHKWGVTNPFTIKVGGISKDVYLTVTGTKKSQKILWATWYYYEYSYDYTKNQEVKGLSENTTSFSIVAPKNSTNDGHSVLVEYIKVPMKKHIRLADGGNGTTSITNVNLGSTLVGTTSSTTYHINLRSFLMEGTQLRYVSDNADFHFGNGQTTKTYTVLANSFAYTGGTANCASDKTHIGNPDNYEADIYFTPSAFNNGSSSATITVYDGNTARATIKVSGTVLTKFYTKAVAHAVPTVGKVWVGVGGANIGDGTNSRGWVNPGSSYTYDWTYLAASSAPKYSYHYYKEDPDGYKFDGWYKNAACTSLHKSDADFVEYVTATTTEKTDLEYWAHWVPVTVNSVNPATSSVTFTEPGTKDVTLTFNVSNADSKADFNEPVISNTADWSLKSWNYSNNQVTVVVSMTVTGNVTARGSHNTTVTLSSKGESSEKSKVATINATVDMNPVYTCNIGDAYMVDDAALDLNTLWTSTSNGAKTYTIVSFTPSGSNNGDATAPAITGSSLSLGQAGTLVLKLAQPVSTSYNAYEVTKTITINKYTNALTCDWGTWSKNLATDDGAFVNFSSNNEVTPITVTQKSGEENATYYPDQHAIYTAFNLGSATWTIAQAENYKYVAPVPQTLTVNIVTVTEGCYAYGPAYPDATAYDVGEIILPKAGSGNVLSFQMKLNLAGDQATVTAFDANNIQLDQWKPSAQNGWSYDDASQHTYTLPAGTKKVYFQRGGSLMDSDNPYINNIRITRTEWITLQDFSGKTISSLDKMVNSIGGNSATATFYVDYSVCAGEVKVASSNPHVTVSPSSFTPTAERQEITVTYSSNVPEEIDATITVYTASQNATLTLSAETEKQVPYLTWGSLYQSEPVSLPVTFTDNAAVTASNEAIITYSVRSGEESIIRVANDGHSFTVVGDGIAHLTATSAESTMWLSVSETKEIHTTNKKIQNIVWNQNFKRSLAPSNERALTAEVYVYDLAAGTEAYSAERTALITYSCPASNGVIEMIDATHFRVLGYGSTTISASVAGNEDFADAATVTKTVVVREAQTGECEPALMYESEDEIEFYAFSLGFPEVVHDIALDHSKGKPDKLNFYVRGVSYNVAIEYYNEGIKVYQSTDGGNTYEDEALAYVYPEKNTTANSETIQLNPNATHLRFVRPQGGRGYHYVGGLTISAIPEFRAAKETLDLGNIGCGATYNGHITLSYFNVKGDLTISKKNSTNGLTIREYIEADCGTSNTINIPFSVFPTEEGSWSNTVTITDALNNISVDIDMTANVTKASQYIIWDPETTITPAEAPILNATASSGLTPVTYAVTSGSDIASIENGEVVITGIGTFKITVSQAGNVSYNSVSATWTFTVNGRYLFNGKIDDDWTKDGNWEIGEVPSEDNDVIIASKVILVTEETVRSMNITTGSVTIAPNGGLTVGAGGISGATKDNLILKADSARNSETKGQTGYLRISPDFTGEMPNAKVELFSKAYYNMKAENHNTESTWQYVGSPIVEGTAARTVFKKSFLYNWNESTGEWENNLASLTLKPFEGYATSQYRRENGMLITSAGQLVKNGNVVLQLTYTDDSKMPGCNVFANSFTAPIDIARIEETDFSDGVDASIHMFNTGSKVNIKNALAKSVDVKAAGQYISIPVKNAKYLGDEFGYPTLIPAMQGFYVNTKKEGTLTLDYDKLVWKNDLTKNPNTPLRVKAYNEETDIITGSLMMTLYTDSMCDNLFVLESNRYETAYENGYDAHKLMNGEFNLFTVENEDQLAVDATNSIIGTRVGVRTGEDLNYTFFFGKVRSERGLALLDIETNETIDINEGTEYSFFAAPNTLITDRFIIVERANVPDVATGVDNIENGTKVQKFIQNGHIFILKNGVLYDVVGKVVR